MKRIFDLCVALFVLVCFFPIFLIVGMLIKSSDKGPVFFQQSRVGKGGVVFKLCKFRSMSVIPDIEKGRFDAGDSSRVTRIGRFLRQTKLDEMPQFINVLMGDMSIVGPRPEIQKWVDVYPERWRFVHTVKPGITDPASILFRNEENILAQAEEPEVFYREILLPEKLSFYEGYVLNQSFRGDMDLIQKTVYTVIFK